MKIVVINSTGPMGSSVVAAIVEKFGYLNIPIRQLGLHDYLVGRKDDQDSYFKTQFLNAVEVGNRPTTVGGVNMLDRDASGARRLIDKSLIEDKLVEIESESFNNIGELYDKCKSAYGRAIQYKKRVHESEKHIELTTDFHKYSLEQLSMAYKKIFGNVYYINMHRDFMGWIESIASQRFVNPKKRFLFVLRWEHKRYMDYENAIKSFEGLHLNFNDIFEQDINRLAMSVAHEIKSPMSDIAWKNEVYDLFGNPKDFDTTFTRADVEGKYFSTPTRKVIQYFISKKKVTRWHDFIVYIFYLFDLSLFLLKKRL